MRVSRTRFSKRRSKRKTEFPIIAIVQKKKKAFNHENNSLFTGSTKQNVSLNPKGASNEVSQLSSSKQMGRAQFSKPQKKSRATIDYKNVILLRNLITAEGKILPRRINKLTAKQQRHVQKAIKSARIMGLIPFINKSRPFS